MVWHVVLAKPRTDASADERAAFVDSLRRAIASIPSVRGVRVGRRVMHGAGYEAHAPDAADYVAWIEFDDLAGLQAYLRDRAHDDLAARFQQTLQSALVYDFEETTIERLA